MAQPKKKRSVTNFKVDDRVRVKKGVKDIDYPDMPLGGWAGTVTDVQGADTITVRWSKETMKAIHPVFLKRCEIDGLDADKYVLTGDDLEPDTGGPLEIEQPKEITTTPLSPKEQDDRIRMVFGLTSNDPLPDVGSDTLEQKHAYLVEHLIFPVDAEYSSETGPFSSRTIRVKVTGLGDPDEPMIDDSYGIICEGKYERRSIDLPLDELKIKKSNPQRELIEDYSYWFHNWI